MKDEVLLEEIGARIKNKRKEEHMTQERLAELMDVSLQMISNLEQGKKAIRPENIIKLCNALSVSADFILRGYYSDCETGEIYNKIKKLSPARQKILEELIDELLK